MLTRRVVKTHEFQFLKQELQYLEETGVVSSGKSKEIQELYEVKERLSFTITLLYVGSILIGTGILSFVASNWAEIGKPVKFLFVLGLFISCNVAGYWMERNFPKTARSLYYLGGLVYGAGIFLIGQMFHFGGEFQDAFLWWSLGILPLAWVLKDKWLVLAAAFFVFIYMSESTYMAGGTIPYWVILWIAAIFVMNEKIAFSEITAFAVGVLQLQFLWTVISFVTNGLENPNYIYGLVYLVLGVGLVFAQAMIKNVYVFLGHLVHGAAALQLSFGEAWPIDWMYMPFSILYLLFALYLIKRGSLLNILILCVMIFRFYLDISFDFLPKSFVFIIGGFILLAFGFYFEKQRKKGGITV